MEVIIIPFAATIKPYTLFVIQDDMADNPRETDENFGTMVCFHSRYDLGDKHGFDTPRDFLHRKLFDMFSSYLSSQYGKPVYDFIKSGKAETARLEYDRTAHEWVLYEKWLGGHEWSKSSSYPASLKGNEVPDCFLDDCLSALKMQEMVDLLENSGQFFMLPLYLYDHSGITMNTSGFSCPWDSGQVGWIYADAERVINEYGELTPETIKKALEVMQAEVKTYDYYITGESYGFQLFEGDVEINSCWGFLGEFRDVQNSIKEFLPKGYESLAENLEDRFGELNINDYLEELEELTNEI